MPQHGTPPETLDPEQDKPDATPAPPQQDTPDETLLPPQHG